MCSTRRYAREWNLSGSKGGGFVLCVLAVVALIQGIYLVDLMMSKPELCFGLLIASAGSFFGGRKALQQNNLLIFIIFVVLTICVIAPFSLDVPFAILFGSLAGYLSVTAALPIGEGVARITERAFLPQIVWWPVYTERVVPIPPSVFNIDPRPPRAA
jgi:hypothetical protein